MTIKRRLQALEHGSNPPAQLWLIDLLEELQAAQREHRDPLPRLPTLRENTDVVVMLRKFGISPVIDTGGEW